MPRPRIISDEILARAVTAHLAKRSLPTLKSLALEAGCSVKGLQDAIRRKLESGKRSAKHGHVVTADSHGRP